MRLTDEQKKLVTRALRSIKPPGPQVVDDNDSPAKALVDHFGDHTFFIDDEGLFILEWVDEHDAQNWFAQAVQLASWSDAANDELITQRPAVRPVEINLKDSKSE